MLGRVGLGPGSMPRQEALGHSLGLAGDTWAHELHLQKRQHFLSQAQTVHLGAPTTSLEASEQVSRPLSSRFTVGTRAAQLPAAEQGQSPRSLKGGLALAAQGACTQEAGEEGKDSPGPGHCGQRVAHTRPLWVWRGVGSSGLPAPQAHWLLPSGGNQACSPHCYRTGGSAPKATWEQALPRLSTERHQKTRRPFPLLSPAAARSTTAHHNHLITVLICYDSTTLPAYYGMRK